MPACLLVPWCPVCTIILLPVVKIPKRSNYSTSLVRTPLAYIPLYKINFFVHCKLLVLNIIASLLRRPLAVPSACPLATTSIVIL